MQRVAQRGVVVGVAGGERRGPLEARDRAGRIADLEQRAAEIVVQHRVLGRERERPAQDRNGRVQLAQPDIGVGQVGQDIGVVRILL